MDKRMVMNALDEAIATVAREEFDRLTRDSSPREVAVKVEGALKSLQSLQAGLQPDYDDEWVALFYILWYQPKHINLTYSMIKALLYGTEDVSELFDEKVCLFDFGSGALAMQFGIAIAAADTLHDGQRFSSIRIFSSDESDAMLSVGQRLWRSSGR